MPLIKASSRKAGPPVAVSVKSYGHMPSQDRSRNQPIDAARLEKMRVTQEPWAPGNRPVRRKKEMVAHFSVLSTFQCPVLGTPSRNATFPIRRFFCSPALRSVSQKKLLPPGNFHVKCSFPVVLKVAFLGYRKNNVFCKIEEVLSSSFMTLAISVTDVKELLELQFCIMFCQKIKNIIWNGSIGCDFRNQQADSNDAQSGHIWRRLHRPPTDATRILRAVAVDKNNIRALSERRTKTFPRLSLVGYL
ncbi:hypothetical protein HPG69_018543 [Diceros bicornis minor]|uniref:Uncharacterized protein n=1 Tax=Diceros bicornis minor TaxID=77932 RepID=A0A7J7EZI9_DICBM|nr:hypothetical protein HPG69_018543 [Diceros bicornis minor]